MDHLFSLQMFDLILFLVSRIKILEKHGVLINRSKRLLVVQIQEGTVDQENAKHIRLTSLHSSCETVKIRVTCSEPQKSIQ